MYDGSRYTVMKLISISEYYLKTKNLTWPSKFSPISNMR